MIQPKNINIVALTKKFPVNKFVPKDEMLCLFIYLLSKYMKKLGIFYSAAFYGEPQERKAGAL